MRASTAQSARSGPYLCPTLPGDPCPDSSDPHVDNRRITGHVRAIHRIVHRCGGAVTPNEVLPPRHHACLGRCRISVRDAAPRNHPPLPRVRSLPGIPETCPSGEDMLCSCRSDLTWLTIADLG